MFFICSLYSGVILFILGQVIPVMISFKKNLPLVVAFVIGGVIVYLVMSLMIARRDLADELARQKVERVEKDIGSEKDRDAEEKYWLEERIEARNLESEKRTEEQVSKGDELKSKFDEFIK